MCGPLIWARMIKSLPSTILLSPIFYSFILTYHIHPQPLFTLIQHPLYLMQPPLIICMFLTHTEWVVVCIRGVSLECQPYTLLFFPNPYIKLVLLEWYYSMAWVIFLSVLIFSQSPFFFLLWLGNCLRFLHSIHSSLDYSPPPPLSFK